MNSIKVKLITFFFAFLMSASVSTMAQDYSTDMTQIADHFKYLSAEERIKIQEALSSLELYTQKIDGKWGAGTSKAMVEALHYIDLTFGFQYDANVTSWHGEELIFQILINSKLHEALYSKYVVGEGDECDGCEEVTGALFSEKDDEVIQSWHFANSKCRGGSGDNPTTMMWCDVRSGIDEILRVQNFCYGRENESGYQMEWHWCEDETSTIVPLDEDVGASEQRGQQPAQGASENKLGEPSQEKFQYNANLVCREIQVLAQEIMAHRMLGKPKSTYQTAFNESDYDLPIKEYLLWTIENVYQMELRNGDGQEFIEKFGIMTFLNCHDYLVEANRLIRESD